jgi:hypothetical protein
MVHRPRFSKPRFQDSKPVSVIKCSVQYLTTRIGIGAWYPGVRTHYEHMEGGGGGAENHFFLNYEIPVPDVQPSSNKSKCKVHSLVGHEDPGGVEVYLYSSFNFGGSVVNATTLSFYLRKRRSGTFCTRRWMGPRHSLRKILTDWDSIPGPPTP